MSQDHNDEEEKPLHFEGGVPIFSPPPQDKDVEDRKERKAQRTYEDRQIALQRGTLWTQIGLVVFGIIGGGIGIWQARVAQQSADTSDKSVLLAQKAERDSVSGERSRSQASSGTISKGSKAVYCGNNQLGNSAEVCAHS